MKTTVLRAALFCCGLAALPVQASLIAYEPFDYPVGLLSGQNGGSGWSTAWTVAASGNSVVSPGRTYSDVVYDLAVQGNALGFSGLNFGNSRDLPASHGTNGSTVYVSFIAKVTSADFAAISLFDGGTERLFMGKAFLQNFWSVTRVGFATSQSTTAVTNESLLVYRFDFSGANVTIRMYVNPPLTAEPSVSDIGDVSRSTFTFNRVRIQAGNGAANATMDEFRIGTTWADVAPIGGLSPHSVAVSGVTQAEGNSGTTNFAFTVSQSRTNNLIVTVNFATADGTAIAGSDYTQTNGTVTFNPGETNKTVTVRVTGDTAYEASETFLLTLSNAVNAVIRIPQAGGVIVNDDFTLPPLVVHEPFEYATGRLTNQNGGTGWNAPWTHGIGLTNLIASPGLQNDDGLYQVVATSNTWQSVGGLNASNTRNLPYTIGETGQVVYLSFIGRCSDLFGYAGVFLEENSTAHFTVGKVTSSSTWSWSRIGGSGIFSTVPVTNQSFVVVRLEFTNNLVNARFYINPPLDAEPVSPAGQALVVSAFKFNRVRLQAGDSFRTDFLDELRIGSTWAAVVPYQFAPHLLTILNAVGFEGNSGTSNLVFNVRMSRTNGLPVTVNYFTTNGTAAAPSDYVATNGVLTFNPGETNKTITVAVTGDLDVEFDETMFVTLSNAVNAQIRSGQGTGTGTIADDDYVPPPLLAYEPMAYAGGLALVGLNGGTGWSNAWSGPFNGANIVSPGLMHTDGASSLVVASNALGVNGAIVACFRDVQDLARVKFGTIYVSFLGQVLTGDQVAILLAGTNSTTTLSIGKQLGGTEDWAVLRTGVNLASGVPASTKSLIVVRLDYGATNTTIRFYVNPPLATEPVVPVGQATTIPLRFTRVRVFTGLSEANAAVFDEIRVASTWAAAVPSVGAPEPGILVNNTGVTEGDAGTTNAVFTAWLTHAHSNTVTVNYSTTNGTANGGSDYIATNGLLTFTPGQTNKTVAVTVSGDVDSEADETFSLVLSNVVNATMLDNTAIGTIRDDDTPPVITAAAGRVFEGDAGVSEAVFFVVLSREWKQPVSVSFSMSNVTATAGVDYQSTNGTLNFAVGERFKTVAVKVFGDTNAEPNEIMALRLSNPVNAALGQNQRFGLIGDDDSLTDTGIPISVAQAGTPVPGEPGRFFQHFIGAPVVNNYNEVAFIAVTDTSPIGDPETGIWMGTEHYLFKVVGNSMTPPAGSYTGTFSALNLDNDGDLLFFAEISPGVETILPRGSVQGGLPKSGDEPSQSLIVDQFGGTQAGGAPAEPVEIASEGDEFLLIRGARPAEADQKPRTQFELNDVDSYFAFSTVVLQGDQPDQNSLLEFERAKMGSQLDTTFTPLTRYHRIVLQPGDPMPGNPFAQVESVDVLGIGGESALLRIQQVMSGVPAGERLMLYTPHTNSFTRLLGTGDSFPGLGAIATILTANISGDIIKAAVMFENGGTGLVAITKEGDEYVARVLHSTPPTQPLQAELVVKEHQTAVVENGSSGQRTLVIEQTPDSATAMNVADLGIPGAMLPALTGPPIQLTNLEPVQPYSVSLSDLTGVYLANSSAGEEVMVVHHLGDHSETALLVSGRAAGGITPAYVCKESNESGSGAGRAVSDGGVVGLFIGTANGNPPNHVVKIPLIGTTTLPFPPLVDFGDAPDSPFEPNYPTTSPRNGARHVVLQTSPRLGQLRDADAGLGQNFAASFDDEDQFDDEDGVTFLTRILPGCPAQVSVVASTAAKLDAWIDFNQDGDWDDPDEKIFNSVSVSAGNNILGFTGSTSIVRPGGIVRGLAYARFRLSTGGNLNYFGLASNGEVEDHIAPLGMALVIAPGSALHQVDLSWQDACELYMLQQSATVNPANWSDVSTGTLIGGFWRLVVPAGNQPVYYRLRKLP